MIKNLYNTKIASYNLNTQKLQFLFSLFTVLAIHSTKLVFTAIRNRFCYVVLTELFYRILKQLLSYCNIKYTQFHKKNKLLDLLEKILTFSNITHSLVIIVL